MIAKVITSGSIKALMNYLTDKKHTVVDMNNVFMNQSIDTVIEEFKKAQLFNQRCKSPNFHIILSFSAEEIITPEKKNDILHDFINQFVGKDQMWIAIEHPETKSHQHMHIALNRIQVNGKALSSSNTAYRCLSICRNLEKKYDLQQLSSFKSENQNIRKEKLKQVIDEAIKKVTNIHEFKNELQKHQFKTIQSRGITFIDKTCGAKINGSALGREYSLMNIMKRIQQGNELEEKTSKNTINVSNETSESSELLLFDLANLTASLLSGKTGSSYQQEETDSKMERKKKKRRRGRRM